MITICDKCEHANKGKFHPNFWLCMAKPKTNFQTGKIGNWFCKAINDGKCKDYKECPK